MDDFQQNNCTITNENQTICYNMISRSNDDNVNFFTSILRDIKLIIATIFVTCLVLCAYNYYLHCSCLPSASKKKKKTKKNEVDIITTTEDDDEDDPFAIEMKARNCNNNNNKPLSSISSIVATKSLAASLANINGTQASGNFLTAIFTQMWEQINIAVSNTIKETLEPTLKDMKVPLHFVKLDLGNIPIKTQNMFIHRVDLDKIVNMDGFDGMCDLNSNNDHEKQTTPGIQIDVDVVWDGNCDIMLQATFTKSAKVTFGVKSIKLSGRMHILLSPLTTELPVISAVQYGFTNPPEIQLDFSGAVLTSVTNKLKFVQGAFISVIQSSLASMLVLPNRMVMPMDLGSYDYLDTYQPPVGMVRLTALRGRGFTILKKMLLNDVPDTYCVMSLGASNKVRTSTKYDNLVPCWDDESFDFILYDMDQKIYVEVFDEDKTPMDPDDSLGKFEITVRELFREPNDGECEVELVMNGENTGCYVTLSAELFHLSEELHSFPDGVRSEKYEGKNELCGLATIIITKAFDIPLPREDAATYIKCVYGEGSEHKKKFYTGVVSDYPGIDALNPMYDCVFHIPLTAAMLQQDTDKALEAAAAAFSSTPTSPASNSSNGGNQRQRRSSTIAASVTKFVKRGTSNVGNSRNDIAFTLIDGDGANGTRGHGKLGEMIVTHDELLRAYKHTITQTRPIGDKGAKLEFRVILSGMQSEEEKLDWAAAGNKSDEDPQTMDDTPSSIYSSVYEEGGQSIRITALRGRGFTIRKRRFGQKNDVPDLYSIIRLINSSKQQVSPPWKTSLIKDDCMPNWNESRDFNNIVDPARYHVSVDIYDNNSKGKDEHLGNAKFSLEQLLRKRLMEVELRNGKVLTKSYVTLRCVQITTSDEKVEVGDVLVHGLGDGGFESTMISKSGSDDGFEESERSDVITPLISMSAPPSLHHSHRSDTDIDDQSTSSVSSTSSMSRKLDKVKNLPRTIGKKLPSTKKLFKKNGNVRSSI